MSRGRLIAVVGPSGVGKDSVLRGMADRAPRLKLVRRAITRAPGLGGEDYDPITEDAFSEHVANGNFCLHWRAHGLGYGIPQAILTETSAGVDHLANLSRSILVQAHAIFPELLVINLTASPETLAERVAERGRENASDAAKRLSRQVPRFDPNLRIWHVANDGSLDETVTQALEVLHLTPKRGSAKEALMR